MKISIATPMYGGNAKASYVSSTRELAKILTDRGDTVYQETVINESLITRARNLLVYNFLKSDSEALLFIDADQGFDPQDVVKMIDSGKDVIGGVYPMKTINWEAVRKAALCGYEDLESYSGYFALNLLDEEQKFIYEEPFKVDSIGTGLLFISRQAFEKLSFVCDTYKANSIVSGQLFQDTVIEYFRTAITNDEDRILLSEDYEFCRMWRSLGESVYAAPWVRVTHIGDYVFRGNLLKTLELNQIPNP